ncbi:uncharacterized protein LOC122721709 [Manihot esculenta]|uniref:uncharacterized protein LOC122721709 n=1 Tax=Manihot esculenta TaxID=3983 RepID=UPI001CC3CD48|nr:uncharacterized protein LOC122721709 [Manihot esculenta]
MAVPACANIHWDGNIINSCNGYDYDGGFSKIIPMGKQISFNQLVGKIARAIGISGNNEFIETISFRKPTIVDGSLKFECMEIWGEDDVCKDADIGSSGTTVESNDEPCEEQNVVDDYGLSNSLAGPSINLSDTVENENEDEDEDEDEDDDDDDSWMSTEDDDDDNGQKDSGSESQYYNTQFPNPIMPVVHPPPYAEIDFDLLRVDPYDRPEGRSFWDPSKEFSVGMIFSSRDAVAAAAKEYHLRHHHQFCYHETREKTYSIKCKDKDSGCAWRLRASKKEGEDIWKITRYSGLHTCTNPQLTKNHSQLDENFICSFIFALIEQQADIKIAALQAEVQDKFECEPSYQKTRKAKQKAIARLYGGRDESYSHRHAGILKAMQKDWWQHPAGHHRYYIRHVLSNYNKTLKNIAIKEALDKATNENQKRKFYEAINNIQEVHHESYD